MIDKKKVEKAYKNDEIDIERATEKLEEFYECAGFSDFRNRELAQMTDWAIIDYYLETFCIEDYDEDELLSALEAIGLTSDCYIRSGRR